MRFDQFCEALNAPVHGHGISAKATDLPFGDPARMVEVADGLTLDLSILNYGAYIKNNTASRCRTTLDDVSSLLLEVFLMEDAKTRFHDSVLERMMIANTNRLVWMKIGDSGCSKFALNGVTSQYVFPSINTKKPNS